MPFSGTTPVLCTDQHNLAVSQTNTVQGQVAEIAEVLDDAL
jgi:hypothetical protein